MNSTWVAFCFPTSSPTKLIQYIAYPLSYQRQWLYNMFICAHAQWVAICVINSKYPLYQLPSPNPMAHILVFLFQQKTMLKFLNWSSLLDYTVIWQNLSSLLQLRCISHSHQMINIDWVSCSSVPWNVFILGSRLKEELLFGALLCSDKRNT